MTIRSNIPSALPFLSPPHHGCFWRGNDWGLWRRTHRDLQQPRPQQLEWVIGVGATMTGDTIATFSSVGPDVWGRMKPEVTAPGGAVVSAAHTSDIQYRTLSGTSMACPHAAGVTAILLAFKETMTYEEVSQALFEGADKGVVTSGRVCDGVVDSVFPNHVFGHGRLDAVASLEGLMKKN